MLTAFEVIELELFSFMVVRAGIDQEETESSD